MAAETESELRSGIGARLRTGRERLGLTVLQAAEKLHLDPAVLEALEIENFRALGAPVFVRGHMRRYAELIGEEPTGLLDLYAASAQSAPPDLTRLRNRTLSPDPRKLVVPALVVLIGFAIVGMVWWVLQEVPGAVGLGTPEGPRALTREPGYSGARGPDASPPASATAAEGTPSVASEARGTAAPPSPPTAAGEATAATRAPTPGAGTMGVTMRFSGASWVEVYDANGQRLFYNTGYAGSARRVSGTPPFRIVLGNVPAVSLTIDGKPATVPTSAVRRDLTARIVIDGTGRIVRARPGPDGRSTTGPFDANADGD